MLALRLSHLHMVPSYHLAHQMGRLVGLTGNIHASFPRCHLVLPPEYPQAPLALLESIRPPPAGRGLIEAYESGMNALRAGWAKCGLEGVSASRATPRTP